MGLEQSQDYDYCILCSETQFFTSGTKIKIITNSIHFLEDRTEANIACIY